MKSIVGQDQRSAFARAAILYRLEINCKGIRGLFYLLRPCKRHKWVNREDHSFTFAGDWLGLGVWSGNMAKIDTLLGIF